MNKRHAQILELLSQKKKIEVTALASLLNVSQVTIRKDLVQLENQGLITRIHGYATLNASDDINNRLAYHYATKQKIAQKAAQFINDGETIMIESGSCCALVALEIAKTKKDITLITNSAFIADYVRKEKGMKIILLGGQYQEESQVNVGPMTRQCVSSFHVDKFFIGTDGFSIQTGFTGTDYMRGETVRDMARQANQIIVVSDSSKFHQLGLVSLVPVDDIHMVITDSAIPDDISSYLQKQNIQLEII